MRLHPLPKVVLTITGSLLLSGIANAFSPVFPDTQFASNDRYNRSSFDDDDFIWQPSAEEKIYSAPPKQPAVSGVLKNSLYQISNYLSEQDANQRLARRGANLSVRSLSHTLDSLLRWKGQLLPEELQHNFDLIPLAKSPQKVTKFTGYYTPIIQASNQPNHEFRYPIYRPPMAKNLRLLPRSMISRGTLNDRGLEIAWTNDPVGLFYMQVQGSGILEYSNGQQLTLSYAGSNEKPFKSLAKYMQQKGYLNKNLGREAIQKWLLTNPQHLQSAMNSNPRYVYFKPSYKALITASGMPIVPGLSVAVDTNFIPFGSIILAEVPVINAKGQRLSSNWRILLPQDRGNAIKGPARMDVYTGKGESARAVANRLTGLGKAYILHKRQTTQLSKNMVTNIGLAPL